YLGLSSREGRARMKVVRGDSPVQSNQPRASLDQIKLDILHDLIVTVALKIKFLKLSILAGRKTVLQFLDCTFQVPGLFKG
ncbi:hypothetical protein BGZ83_007404, partial [Gryganskiella cystojenkinii]